MSEALVRETLEELVRPKMARAGVPGLCLEKTDLVGTGIVDSLDVITLIGDVEQRTGARFAWDKLNTDQGVTVPALVEAFA